MADLLVFGSGGQVGSHLMRLAAEGALHVEGPARPDADLDRPETIAAAIAASKAPVVVNAAAWTDVPGAERDEAAAIRANAEAPAVMAQACARASKVLIHISTDFVFDGEKTTPYVESDPVAPLNAYGRGKAAGERAVLETYGRALVVRTSWVFSAQGRNFVTAIRAAGDRPRLDVVEDEIGLPTPADDLAGFLLEAALALRDVPAGDPRFGLLHAPGGGAPVSRAEFARMILTSVGSSAEVVPVTAASRNDPVRRPANAVLHDGRLQRLWGRSLPDWRLGLARTLAELEEWGQ
ncbi:dTDP-4-dehydrorhamnose reductase [Brevundimonas sp. 2R-24]|uniref:dTDP-4-dehydrorhamnose reductase n=1 Tax=Peiella sedimenti TaxID=3061083 RepID=A0ABT8SNZ3_9CAUL|nr:dTDP-4-dehydrorhamnose reductase [Caulobacteraceae bacterium XZ-24]